MNKKMNEECLNNISMYESITDIIGNIYQNLSDLEIQGLKESENYQAEVDLLEKYLDMEKAMLTRFKESEYFEKIIKYFEEKYNITVGIVISATGSYNEAKNARIANKLNEAMLTTKNDDLTNGDFIGDIYVTEVYNDFIRLALSIFENNNHQIENSEKIKIKYRVALSLPTLEREYLSSNFTTNLNPYMANGLLLYSEDEKELSKYIIENEAKALFVALGQKIVDFSPNMDEARKSSIVFSSCIIRAAFALAPIQSLEQIKQYSGTILETLSMIPEGKFSLELFKEVLNSRKKDKNIPQYLSFGR